MRWVRARLSDERGYSLIELMVSMSILASVMASVSILLVSATNSEVDMNRRFQAQTDARIGLDRLRREVHCAQSVAISGGGTTATLTIPSTCPTAGGLTSITWCTKANGTRWDLWRYQGGSCSGTGRTWAGSINQSVVFTYSPQSTSSLAYLTVNLPVNVNGSKTISSYVLSDNIVLRNSTRT
ncbi:MAG TPA: prepilin-type N-terminal cleavage/methylation domain-containing protein [Gaiellaceae bacterium]|nr:prepilin-type N-terminal cleavage/methylation domain-containing protein [Gaiellaceae bacterium]